MQKIKYGVGAVAVGLFMLAGCSSSNNGSGSSAEATSSQGAAAATASEATAIASSMTEAQVTASGGVNTDLAHPQTQPEAIAGCPAITVKSTGPSGGWTDEVLAFANPPCSYTGVRGFDTLALTGTLELTRDDADGFNFGSTATNLAWTFTNPTDTYSETRNGTRAVTASADSASATNNMTIAFQGAMYSGTFVHQMTAAFTPVSGSVLAKGSPLPSGDFTYTGAAQWTGSGGADDTFAITTVTPLAYDATCKGTSASVFDSGEIHVHLSSDSGNAYGKVTWSGCNAPSVSFVAD